MDDCFVLLHIIYIFLVSQAQAMKEQAQLREEMAYQYKVGNLEVSITDPHIHTHTHSLEAYLFR